MHIPSEFDSIRPFEPEELPKVFDRLLADPQFQQVLAYLYPNVPMDAIAQRLHVCKTNVDFQKAFCYEFLQKLLAQKAKSCDMDATSISNERNYTFISNHRDIVLDSGLLAKLLIDHNFPTTCEIAIGDNLLSLPWVKDLVRVNKAFIVERSVSFREMLATSKRLSAYMHFAIEEKKENIWIAQREGRAKDSDDRTAESILKMMAMGGEGNIIERLQQLHLVPLAISYEYDPCDYLKAAEFQLKRDNPDWQKGSQDDIVSMQTGIMGYKGHIHYHCAPCIDDYLSTLDANMPKADLYRIIAAHIDQEIHRNYRIYPNNYVAYDLLEGNNATSSHYTPQDKAAFEQYLSDQLAKIDIPNKDEAYLRERMLTMYANPLKNHLAAC
ncbi:acyltransferase [Prevotella sp. BV3P1]|uniref:1-acyl-sn-glycerol-3-phosphate acyltransferase n=1 Tax=Prevotellaceae TaxID=171552 RepID=UPI0003B8BAA1|nr:MULTISPECIES: 1-acyl-sn-glycerol-3-phosphate acyltransferase [Prevotellaceae]ERT62329.1 acyltransferase [Prevotella sp. BV3P1]KGF39488.1 acyltransferase [Hoylesella buccalis DNF00985]